MGSHLIRLHKSSTVATVSSNSGPQTNDTDKYDWKQGHRSDSTYGLQPKQCLGKSDSHTSRLSLPMISKFTGKGDVNDANIVYSHVARQF